MRSIRMIFWREVKTRIKSRTFIGMSILGPLVILTLLFTAIYYNVNDVQTPKVLVADEYGILQDAIRLDSGENIQFDFIGSPVSNEDFLNKNTYKDYDYKLEINEAVLKNRTAILVYRDFSNPQVETTIQRMLQRRVEELKVSQMEFLTLEHFLKLKEPIHLVTEDAQFGQDGKLHRQSITTGLLFSIVVFVFIFLFSIQILKSTLEEKTNKVSEILLTSVKPFQILMGKILGGVTIGLVQSVIWMVVIGLALWGIQSFYFPDIYDPNNWQNGQINPTATASLMQDPESVIALIYQRINFPLMIGASLFFFIGGYLVYGSIFAAIGSIINRETESQQFLIPVMLPLILCLAYLAYMNYYPSDHQLRWLSIFPLTAPLAMIMRIAIGGFSEGQVWELYLSGGLIIITFIVTTWLAGKSYQYGMLKFSGKAGLSTIRNIFRN